MERRFLSAVSRGEISMRVPDVVKKCVAFFGVPSTKENVVTTKYSATGFFVSVPINDTYAFYYLVTAKHVALELQGKEFVLRANKKDGTSILFESPGGDDVRWHFHPTDENADVAVFPWSPQFGEEVMEYKPLSTRNFLKVEALGPEGVGIGDEVCVVGLFNFHEGKSRNHPMARIGNIAMIPDERVQTKRMGPMEAYLIEARSTGGMSGSPVFVAVKDKKPRENLSLYTTWALLGMIHGHWDLLPASLNETSVNVGVAIVTPAQKILDVLNCEEVAQVRREVVERDLGDSNLPIPDA